MQRVIAGREIEDSVAVIASRGVEDSVAVNIAVAKWLLWCAIKGIEFPLCICLIDLKWKGKFTF